MGGTVAEPRDELVAILERELLGPTNGELEILGDPPSRRYLVGTLFPVPRERVTPADDDGEGVTAAESHRERETGDPTGGREDDQEETPVDVPAQFLPSSFGLSFLTTAEEIRIDCAAGRYSTLRSDEGRRWQRQPTMRASLSASSTRQWTVFDEDRGRVDVVWRKRAAGNLVTVTLANARPCRDEGAAKSAWDDLLTQTELDISVPVASVMDYPRVTAAFDDDEQAELEHQYRDHRVLAIGHGAAATWHADGDTLHLVASHLPTAVVPQVSTDVDDPTVDRLAFDAGAVVDGSAGRERVCDALATLVDSYAGWIGRQDASQDGTGPVRRILDRARAAHSRMIDGIRLLRRDDQAWEAFALAQQAMVLQYHHGTDALAGRRRTLDEPADLTTRTATRPWRPFQIAFLLQVMPSLVDPGRSDRQDVDLLWFPTGGGKTEAYLLTACFEIMHRRLTGAPRSAGTTVISRYTLSLLTTQQFQRAAGAVLACEHIRRRRDDLGDVPISLGLWVGESTTPNKIRDAVKLFHSQRGQTDHDDVWMIERCPWCGTEIMPRRRHDDDARYGVTADSSRFALHCPRTDCEFHDGLPVAVVDEMLYPEPPTFLLATVDKFADLAWDRRGGAFLGAAGRYDPPGLIIQDELHLVTGPLGTTVAVYEHAIETACAMVGQPPKVIASSATVRRATEQVQGLYGRRVAVFPPPGPDEDDSYFATVNDEAPGRRYLGVMPQGHTSDTAVVHLLTALLQGFVELEDPPEADPLSTVVAYHNSLQELGRTVTIARDDVPARLESRFGADHRAVPAEAVEELTSNISRAEQPRLLERLARTYGQSGHIAVLAATNMLSVGVDIPRLGSMLMVGQPKTTAEYIQATSRVGRASPGLVVTFFRSTRPRDRSHFETFFAYHDTLYRHVEPGSVTPYSEPSRRRSLHAALVILARHALGLGDNDAAKRAFPEHSTDLDGAVKRILHTIELVDPREVPAARDLLRRYLKTWEDKAVTGAHLGYSDYSPIPGPRLLRDFSEPDDGAWATARSMRNVDRTTHLRPLGRSRQGGRR